MSRRVVVTGLGVVVPGATTTDQFHQILRSGSSQITPITRFDVAGHASPAAGQVADDALTVFSVRLRKRMDRFCQMAMVAAQQAFSDAGLQEPDDREAIGVYLGNMFAGWQIAEPSMRQLCQIGYSGVSPYIASAWFPTAAQGQISIHWGLRGFSKTVSADTASSALAFGYAARAIAQGRADVLLAGGAEAPVTPYISTFCSTSGRVTPTRYAPFTPTADGFQVGEGSVIFVLEEREHALARGARIMAEVAGFSSGHADSRHVFGPAGASVVASVTGRALAEAAVTPDQVDYVGLDAQGTVEADRSEADGLHRLFGNAATPVCSSAKPVTGHLLGAGAAVELAAALLALVGRKVPLMPQTAAGGTLRLATPERADAPDHVRTALVHSRGADGTVAACLLTAA